MNPVCAGLRSTISTSMPTVAPCDDQARLYATRGLTGRHMGKK
jgi:hypothetical protein